MLAKLVIILVFLTIMPLVVLLIKITFMMHGLQIMHLLNQLVETQLQHVKLLMTV